MPDIVRGWTPTGFRGLAALLFGGGTLLFEVAPVINLIVLFGLYVLVDAILMLAAAHSGAGGPGIRSFLIIEGLVGIGASLATFGFYPYWSMALFDLVAVWAVITGVLRVGQAVHLRQDRRGGWPLLLLAGLASLPVGYLLFALYGVPGMPVRVIGAYSIGVGVMLLVAANRLHEPRNRHPVWRPGPAVGSNSNG